MGASLVLEGYGVAFGQRVVLADLTLALPLTGVDVVMGPVKSGKSTLLRSLAGVYDGHPLHRQWGRAEWGGTPLGLGHRPRLVQQHARALDQPLWQTLKSHAVRCDGDVSPWRDWAADMLRQYGLGVWLDAVDQPLLHAPMRLQRAALVLTQVLSEAGLVLIDEPTYGLPDADAWWLVDWLRTLGERNKLCITLHNQQQARRMADRIVLIGGGRVLAHQASDVFWRRPANDWVAQFCRTGSLPLPSPDALPCELDVAAPAPPPLPPSALRAVAAGSVPVQLVPLPQPSRSGVEMASSVGQVVLSDSRGPQGFRWVVPGVLAGCPAPGNMASLDYDLDLLAQAGVSCLITLTETDLDTQALKRHGLRNTHLPIIDREAPSLHQMHMLLLRMQRLIEKGEVLAVHCKAGLGRTGVVLAAWLIREGGLSAEAAIDRIRRVQPGYIQSVQQEAFLHEYENDIVRRLR